MTLRFLWSSPASVRLPSCIENHNRRPGRTLLTWWSANTWLSPNQDHHPRPRTEGRHAYYCAYFFNSIYQLFFSVAPVPRSIDQIRSCSSCSSSSSSWFYFNTADQTTATSANTKVSQILSKSSCCCGAWMNLRYYLLSLPAEQSSRTVSNLATRRVSIKIRYRKICKHNPSGYQGN